jgi:hypothetical protein
MAKIYVKYDATGSNNGSSWTNAYTSLQSGITMASSGTSDQIWVSSGTYYPSTEVGGSGSLFKSFAMKKGVPIYGGFNGTETDLSQRDYATNIVILNGTGCYHVFNNKDLVLTSTAILDGFTISGGTASGSTPHNYGGGILNYTTNSTLTNTCLIRNCRFTGNLSIDSGGAIYNSRYCSPTIYNCSFDNNTTLYKGGAIASISNNTNIMKCNFYNNSKTSGAGTYGGGAIHIGTSYATNVNNISNCNFYNNDSNGIGVTDGGKGGAIYTISEPGTLNIVNCFFSGNTAEYGGAILVRTGNDTFRETSTITIKNCIVSGNTATYGGGIFNDNHNTIINNTKIIGNYALQQSGGIYNRYGRPIISSCLITGNKAVNYGGGMYCNSVPTGATLAQVINCTISGNYAERGGAIGIISNSQLYLKNSILSGNIGATNGNNLYLDSSGCTMNLDYCQYTTGSTDNYIYSGATFTVTNCTTSDPIFVDPIVPTDENTPNTLGDYRLKGTSPLINAGLNTNVTLPIDIRGQQRKIGNLTYSLRDTGPAGGSIFYINPNYLNDGWRYIEASSVEDETAIRWSNITTAIETTSTSIGTGSGNTYAIISQSGFTSGAASLCNNLILNTFDDWFLPSQDELNLMYQNLYLFGVGNLSNVSYWSSSEVSSTNAYRQAFSTGLKSSSPKTNTYRARAIRRFTSIPKYTLTYNGNEYTSGTLPSDNTEYNQGSDVTILSSGGLTHYSDTFLCWNTQADGFGLDYQTGTTFKISSNTTLYAKWSYDTIVILPDTQSYVKYKEEVLTSQLDWIVDNKDSNNIKFVGHVGDIIQDYGINISQWTFAKSEMSKLTGSTIPYAITFGNHDYVEHTRNSVTGNTFFPLSIFEEMPTFGNSYDTNCENTYHMVNIKGEDTLIFLLEFGPRQSVIDWANDILEQHSGKTAIIITHAYLSWEGQPLYSDDNHAPSNGYGLGDVPTDVNDGSDIWTKIISPNNNIKIVVCGHDGKTDVGSALRITGHTNGDSIYEIMSNFQYYASFPGYLVILKFISNKVYFRTYSPYLEEYKTDSYSQGDWNW